MIGCGYVEARLRALLDGELEPGVSRKVLAHLDRCARCREEHARLKAVSSLLQEQELEDVPAHFTASLQVRLASHRRARAAAMQRKPQRLALPWQWTPRRRWAGALVTAGMTAAVCFFAFSPGIQASEVARRAERSWLQIRNYGCVFNSRGVYRGEERTFTQKQFFRRPGEFRLDTGQDYRLTTFVKPDRVVHYLPGGEWKGKGPLVIVRPRTDAEEALPFPFGVTWQSGGNVSLDQLVRQLRHTDDAAVMGTELVGDRECYRVRFSAVPPGGNQRDRYELWVDRESFLPRRVSWYRDELNHIITEAQFLQVNYDVLPLETFDFQIPGNASVIHGDIDPHVLALPFIPARDAAFDTRPVASAQTETWKRRDTVPFPVFSPRWLPRGFELIRVRRKEGRWLDAHWIRPDVDGRGSAVVKLVEQDGSAEARADLRNAEQVNLGTAGRPILARLREGTAPYPHVYLSWRQGGTRCTLFAAELRPSEVLRIARSMAEARAPEEAPVRIARRGGRPRMERSGEPSVLPTEAAVETVQAPPTVEPPAASAPVEVEQPPMMPEMADDEKPAVDAATTTR